MNKWKKIVGIVLCSVVAVLILLAALTYIPRAKTLDYDLYGYIIRPDGQILEEFTFTITGKEYDFIIDPPGGTIGFSGEKLTQLERDAFILYFDWNSPTITKNYSSGHYDGDYHPTEPRYVLGTLSYYSGTTNLYHWETGMLDLENGAFCMYADDLIENAFVVGVSDPDADPMAALEPYLKYVKIPDLQPAPEN